MGAQPPSVSWPSDGRMRGGNRELARQRSRLVHVQRVLARRDGFGGSAGSGHHEDHHGSDAEWQVALAVRGLQSRPQGGADR